MLNKEKVILMTRMTAYEKGKGKENLRIGTYFRSDYIWAAILKAVFAITFAFIVGLALYIYYNYEVFLENIYEMDIISLLLSFRKYYFIVLIIYVALAYVVAFVKYAIASSEIRKYKSNLKKIRKLQKGQ